MNRTVKKESKNKKRKRILELRREKNKEGRFSFPLEKLKPNSMKKKISKNIREKRLKLSHS